MVNFFVISQIKLPKENYTLTLIATNESNGDLLCAVEGDLSVFDEDYPEASSYYEADWFQNYYPDAPGVNPIEKYYNALNMITDPNPPIWSNILSEIARNHELFLKLLTTTEPNAFSALLTVIQHRNMDLFKELALKVVASIPGGLLEEESASLNAILENNNFPNLAEMSV
ncbi:MAG: hypothetical protein ACKPCP_22665 [Sphaerospermopsis kisseleviana]